MRLALALPGRWFTVPIGSPDARQRIRELAQELHGGADDRAGIRIALRRRIEAALERAEAGRAEQLHLGISLEGIPTDGVGHGADVPMPAVASVYQGVPVSTAESTAPDAVMAALVPLVLRAAHEPFGGSAIPGDDDRVFRAGASRILRRPSIRDPGEEGTLPSLAADYWLTVPGERRAVLLHLDVPLLAPTELLLALCDGIALAARFEPTGSLSDELRNHVRARA
ncbi:hypothetical protein [Agrococcus sp. ARC_14]|uniref:hypothetical protein n=1 Tax=Agrococcus sp. ARC_14 TaxID=2919927 RepID=UPI001F05AF0E|nr:hypothetical protein [Agrococcus sp. ARC_14]MCH1884144.1 hypothetical protein [Agrococcus sp. ARC_14]